MWCELWRWIKAVCLTNLFFCYAWWLAACVRTILFVSFWIGMYLIVVVCGSVRTNLFISFLPVDRDVPDTGATSGVPSFSFLF
jgi:hypothetical protein